MIKTSEIIPFGQDCEVPLNINIPGEKPNHTFNEWEVHPLNIDYKIFLPPINSTSQTPIPKLRCFSDSQEIYSGPLKNTNKHLIKICIMDIINDIITFRFCSKYLVFKKDKKYENKYIIKNIPIIEHTRYCFTKNECWKESHTGKLTPLKPFNIIKYKKFAHIYCIKDNNKITSHEPVDETTILTALHNSGFNKKESKILKDAIIYSHFRFFTKKYHEIISKPKNSGKKEIHL